jgi:hypothetical protein
MNLKALGVPHPSFKGPEWMLLGIAIVALAVVGWESWETKMGNDRPELKAAAGITFAFLAGISIEQGIWLFQSHASTYRWAIDVLMGLVSLLISIFYIYRRKAPRNVIEWLNERAKPPLMFDKKDD